MGMASSGKPPPLLHKTTLTISLPVGRNFRITAHDSTRRLNAIGQCSNNCLRLSRKVTWLIHDRTLHQLSLVSNENNDTNGVIKSFHNIHNVVDCGINSMSANHAYAYLKTLYQRQCMCKCIVPENVCNKAKKNLKSHIFGFWKKNVRIVKT